MKTYSEFFKSLPENVRVQIKEAGNYISVYTPEEFLIQFTNATRLDPEKTELKKCQYVIVFN